jgi:hypothetical protein
MNDSTNNTRSDRRMARMASSPRSTIHPSLR